MTKFSPLHHNSCGISSQFSPYCSSFLQLLHVSHFAGKRCMWDQDYTCMYITIYQPLVPAINQLYICNCTFINYLPTEGYDKILLHLTYYKVISSYYHTNPPALWKLEQTIKKWIKTWIKNQLYHTKNNKQSFVSLFSLRYSLSKAHMNFVSW